MQLEISVLSNPGGRERNEDAYGFWTGSGCCFAIVSDGAGGHGGGDVASRLAVRIVLSGFQEHPTCTAKAIDDGLHAAHRAILAQQPTKPELVAMRATATVLAIDTAHDTAVWGHVGDTRLYCFRDGAIVAQTKDHSVVQKLVDAGYLAQNAVRQSLERSKLFAALGHEEDVPVALHDTPFPLVAGDVFLLCTDGFWEYVDESTMIAMLGRAATPAEWLESMVADVVSRGGREQDNFSALAIFCRPAAA
ncbi:MAG: protein phosphatase 2C domain-containing protein [Burkholderiaceae bacterium]